MKKVLSITGIAMLAVGLHAVNLADVSAAYANREYDKAYQLCIEKLPAAKQSKVNRRKVNWAIFAVLSKIKAKKITTFDAAMAEFNRLAAEVGATGNLDHPKCEFLYNLGEDAKAIEIGRDSQNPLARYYAAVSLSRTGSYAAAADLAFNSGIDAGYHAAIRWAIRAKLPEKVFEYSIIAFSKGKMTNPVFAKQVINYFLTADLTGTSVTDAKLKVFLQTVNRRCSRFLKPGIPTGWDEVIQLVRQTLETF